MQGSQTFRFERFAVSANHTNIRCGWIAKFCSMWEIVAVAEYWLYPHTWYPQLDYVVVRKLLFSAEALFYLVEENNLAHTANDPTLWQEQTEIRMSPHSPKSQQLQRTNLGNNDQEVRCHNVIQRLRRWAAVVSSALLALEELRAPQGKLLTQSLMASVPNRLNCVTKARSGYAYYWELETLIIDLEGNKDLYNYFYFLKCFAIV